MNRAIVKLQPVGPGACVRRSVSCLDSGSLEHLAGVCTLSSWNVIERRPGQPEETVFSTLSETAWFLSRRDRQWHIFVADAGDIPRLQPGNVEFRDHDDKCLRAVGDKNLDGFESGPVIER